MNSDHTVTGVRCWLCVARFTAVLALTVAAHAILETARDSLFLAHLPPSRLPWMYLAVTVCVLAVTRLQQHAGGHPSRRSFPVLLGAATLVTTAFWVLRSGGPWVVAALYLWSALFSSLLLIQFWVRAEEGIGWVGAKRAFAVIAVGGPLGALLGSVLARSFLIEHAPQQLLLLSAGLTAAAAATAVTLPRRHSAAHGSTPATVPLRTLPGTVARDPYLRLLLVMGMLAAVAATLVDFLFKQALVARLPADRIPSMIANGYLAQSALALVVQLVAVRWLFASAGVARSLLLLPAGLFVAALGLAVGGGVALAFLGRVLDGGLRPSLQRTGTELLYLPLPEHRRRLFKPAVDVVSQRLGQALASVLILGAAAIGVAGGWLAGALALVSLGWAEATRRLHPRYLDLFRERLRSGQAAPDVSAPLDLGALEALMAALSARNDREVLAAMDLLVHYGRGRLIPGLVLYHPSAQVLRAALRHFARMDRKDDLAHVERLMAHPDEQVRAAVVRRWTQHHPVPRQVLELASADASPVVRAAALVALALAPGEEEALRRITELARRGTPAEQQGLASALASAPSDGFAGALLSLAKTEDPATRTEVVRAMAALPRPAFVPDLVAMLEEPSMRAAARGALVGCGPPAFAELSRRLLEDDGPWEVLREIPAALGRFAPERAAPVLLARLAQARGGLPRFRALRTLNRLRRDYPELRLDDKQLETALDVELRTALRNRDILRSVRAEPGAGAGGGPATALLVRLLEDKELLAVERVFRVLQLLFPGERMEPIYRGLRSPDPEVRASAEELLESLVAPSLCERLLELVRPVGSAPAGSTAGRRRLLEALLGHRSEVVQTLTVRAASELGLSQLLPRLRRLAGSATGELRLAIDQAVFHLAGKRSVPSAA